MIPSHRADLSINNAEAASACCASCGKERRSGSLTSWIFNSEGCVCGIIQVPQRSSSDNAEPAKTETESQSDQKELAENDSIAHRYVIQSKIGRGGMGTVYKAFDSLLKRECAIKVLSSSDMTKQANLKRFEQEVRAASGLSHPNLVSVYDCGIVESTAAPYLVMEYVCGSGLDQVIDREGPLTPERTIDILIQVCNALEHAHKKGIVHRDIKPSNIIITHDPHFRDVVKVVDFGIAKIIAADETDVDEDNRLTQSGEIFGSPLYMSPEQCAGALTLDARSDIYSLFCVMFEMLTGSPPFPGDNALQIFLKHVHETVPLAKLNLSDKALQSSLEIMMLVGLAKQPHERYKSAEELRLDLLLVKKGERPLRRAKHYAARARGLTMTAVITSTSLLLLAILAVFSNHLSLAQSESAYDRWKLLDFQGQRLFDQGDYDGARRSFKDALRLAQDSESGDALAKASLDELTDLARAEDNEADVEKYSGLAAQLNIGQSNESAVLREEITKALLDASNNRLTSRDSERLERMIQSANDAATALIEDERYDEAAALLDPPTIKLTRLGLGTSKQSLLRTMGNIAYNNLQKGDLDQALPQYEATLAAERKSLSPDDPLVAKTIVGLARIYTITGKKSGTDIEKLLTEALNINRQVFGPQSQQVAWVRVHLAQLYMSLNNKLDAQRELSAALAAFQAAQEPDLVREASCYGLLGSLTGNAADSIKALEFYERFNHKRSSHLVPALIHVADMLNQEHPQEAKFYYVRALALLPRLSAHNQPLLAGNIHHNLAAIFRSQEEEQSAESVCQKGVAFAQRHFGANSWQECQALNDLAEVYLQQGKVESAQIPLTQAFGICYLRKDSSDPATALLKRTVTGNMEALRRHKSLKPQASASIPGSTTDRW